MRLSRLVLGLGAALLVAGGLVIVEAGPAAAATCALPAPVGGVITLTADCDTTIPLVIPDGVTLDGAGHTITAHDPVGGFFSGAVVTNAGTSMIIQNLTIVGSFPTAAPGCGRGILEGIRFNDAGGSVSNVTVDGITEGSGCNPTTGIGIRAEGVAAARTVTITNTTVTGYQRNGMDARGTMTMNVSGSTIGPPQDLNNIIGQNGVVYFQSAAGQPGGTVSGNTIFGNGDAVQNVSTTAVLLAGAKDVTITQNTITSDPSQKGTDVGIFVANGSTGVTISSNNITRANADDPRPRRCRGRGLQRQFAASSESLRLSGHCLIGHADLQHLQRMEHQHRGGHRGTVSHDHHRIDHDDHDAGFGSRCWDRHPY